MEWHTIKGYNRNKNFFANRMSGVELPDIGSDVLVVYPDIGNEVYTKTATEYGMSGTLYYDGTMWAYYDRPQL